MNSLSPDFDFILLTCVQAVVFSLLASVLFLVVQRLGIRGKRMFLFASLSVLAVFWALALLPFHLLPVPNLLPKVAKVAPCANGIRNNWHRDCLRCVSDKPFLACQTIRACFTQDTTKQPIADASSSRQAQQHWRHWQPPTTIHVHLDNELAVEIVSRSDGCCAGHIGSDPFSNLATNALAFSPDG